jgi:hypothetical protein
MRNTSKKTWYGYTDIEWKEAFKAKELAEKQCREDNLKAARKLAMMRQHKYDHTSKACFRLLYNICKALNLK